MDQGRLDTERKASTLNLWKNLQGSQIVVCTDRRDTKENQDFLQSYTFTCSLHKVLQTHKRHSLLSQVQHRIMHY
jgi:hypothetical protein